jgi:mannosyltransferase
MKKPQAKTADWLLRLNTRVYLGLVIALGVIVRFVGIAKSSVWHDEGYSLMLAPQTFAQIWHHTGLDVHPLYYFTLHLWMQVFGTTETAVRSLSAVLMILVIPIMYALVRRLFTERSARVAALFTALAPFLVRYSQEARMYGMLAFIASLATYMLVRAQQTRKWSDWLIYGVVVAAGLYTYYYIIFLIVFHWAYMACCAVWPKPTWAHLRETIFSSQWIAANALAVLIWLPWIPTAYVQLVKIQTPPWIPKATINTLPSSFGQFMTFTDVGGKIGGLPLAPVRNLIFLVFVGLFAAFLVQRRSKPLPVVLMGLYMGLTPFIVWALSFGAHPKYIDRYLLFAAVAFYAVLAVLYTEAWPWAKWRWLATASIVLTVAIFAVGIYNVNRQGTHQMRQLTGAIAANFQPGDNLLAGDFYTFFDFSYYAKQFKLSSPVLAYVPNQFPGCCEGRSLLADQPQLVLKSFNNEHPASGYIWVIGHPGAHDYFDSTNRGGTVQ